MGRPGELAVADGLKFLPAHLLEGAKLQRKCAIQRNLGDISGQNCKSRQKYVYNIFGRQPLGICTCKRQCHGKERTF